MVFSIVLFIGKAARSCLLCSKLLSIVSVAVIWYVGCLRGACAVNPAVNLDILGKIDIHILWKRFSLPTVEKKLCLFCNFFVKVYIMT